MTEIAIIETLVKGVISVEFYPRSDPVFSREARAGAAAIGGRRGDGTETTRGRLAVRLRFLDRLLKMRATRYSEIE